MTNWIIIEKSKFWTTWADAQNPNLHKARYPLLHRTSYYYNGQFHRENGPAIEHDDGRRDWYYYGDKVECKSQEEFERMVKMKALW